MVSFVNTGDWFKESGVEPLKKFVPPRRYYCLLNIVVFSLFTLISFFYLAGKIIISGNLIYISLLALPIVLRELNIIIITREYTKGNIIFIYSSRGLVQIVERHRNK